MNRYAAIFEEHKASRAYELDSLVDADGVLTLRLKGDEEARLELVFDAYVAYRKLDEGDAMLTLRRVSDTSALGRTFYEVAESEFVAWYVAQGYGVRKGADIRHFTILTQNDVIDVLALSQPVISGQP